MIDIKLTNSNIPYSNVKLILVDGDRRRMQSLDFYWLRIDNLFLKNESSHLKGILNFLFLLNIWKKKLKNKLESEVFLPFDFSDQYIGGVIVKRKPREILDVGYGFSRELIGAGYSPTSSEEINIRTKDLTITFDFFEMEMGDLIDCIDDGIYNVLSSGLEEV